MLLSQAVLGMAMVVTFMTLIMTKRMSPIAALISIPIVFGLLAGAGNQLGELIIGGVVQVAPIALMLAFAVLYFAVMMDAGLFDPLVNRVLKMVGTDPLRIAFGSAALVTGLSIDGDGTTTALIVITAFLPVYRKVGMNPLILGVLLVLGNSLMNILPWGGPTARAASAVNVDVSDVFLPLVAPILVGLVATFLIAWRLGLNERRRLGFDPSRPDAHVRQPDAAGDDVLHASDAPGSARRPRLFWFNLGLTVALLVGMLSGLAPLPVLMMSAFAIAITVNYPDMKAQKERMESHALNVVNVVLLILAAGSFTGILNGTGMSDAMAGALLSIVPDDVGRYLAPITALASMPLTFVMSNDAYYFGIVPVIAAAAANFGIPAEAIARASLLGQPVHTMSPLLAPIYLACGLLGVDVAEAQRFCLKWAVLVCLVVLAAALLTGAIPLAGSGVPLQP